MKKKPKKNLDKFGCNLDENKFHEYIFKNLTVYLGIFGWIFSLPAYTEEILVSQVANWIAGF